MVGCSSHDALPQSPWSIVGSPGFRSKQSGCSLSQPFMSMCWLHPSPPPLQDTSNLMTRCSTRIPLGHPPPLQTPFSSVTSSFTTPLPLPPARVPLHSPTCITHSHHTHTPSTQRARTHTLTHTHPHTHTHIHTHTAPHHTHTLVYYPLCLPVN